MEIISNNKNNENIKKNRAVKERINVKKWYPESLFDIQRIRILKWTREEWRQWEMLIRKENWKRRMREETMGGSSDKIRYENENKEIKKWTKELMLGTDIQKSYLIYREFECEREEEWRIRTGRNSKKKKIWKRD